MVLVQLRRGRLLKECFSCDGPHGPEDGTQSEADPQMIEAAPERIENKKMGNALFAASREFSQIGGALAQRIEKKGSHAHKGYERDRTTDQSTPNRHSYSDFKASSSICSVEATQYCEHESATNEAPRNLVCVRMKRSQISQDGCVR